MQVRTSPKGALSRLRRGGRRRLGPFAASRLVRLLTGPVSESYGFDRGRPVDRVYIEEFMARHASDVRGRVLEVKDDAYTRRFGGDRVEQRDIVDVDARNTKATVVADLDVTGSLPESTYDCIILTQVLEFLRPERALPNLYQALRPGGVLLVSVPFLCRLETSAPDLRRYTARGLEVLVEQELPPDAIVSVEQRGNCIAAVAFLLGLAEEDLAAGTLAQEDFRFPLVSFARICRP